MPNLYILFEMIPLEKDNQIWLQVSKSTSLFLKQIFKATTTKT